MLEPKGRSKNTATVSVAQSLQTIHRFFDCYSMEHIKEKSWNLIMYAFGNEEMEGISHLERSNLLFFYEQINKLCEALVVIDKELVPLFKVEGE
ncbi:MAG: hypothetical protein IPJ81_07565 [Chitinophagaceae bacterium]|nr:hypothetical protein [Chitinophagaceae bacterium]